jgi:hypothetical protein
MKRQKLYINRLECFVWTTLRNRMIYRSYNRAMNNAELSRETILSVFDKMKDKPVTPFVWYAGVLDLEIGNLIDVEDTTPGGKTFMTQRGEYSLTIWGKWVIQDRSSQISQADYDNGLSADDIKRFLGTSKLKGITIDKNPRVVTLDLSNDKQIMIIDAGISRDYLYLSTRDEIGASVVLNSDFKFIDATMQCKT